MKGVLRIVSLNIVKLIKLVYQIGLSTPYKTTFLLIFEFGESTSLNCNLSDWLEIQTHSAYFIILCNFN